MLLMLTGKDFTFGVSRFRLVKARWAEKGKVGRQVGVGAADSTGADANGGACWATAGSSRRYLNSVGVS